VTLYDGAAIIGSALADALGWSIVSTPLADGVHHITATATDAVGNVSIVSQEGAVTIDTLAPPVPIVTLAHDSGVSATDHLTSDPSIAVVATDPAFRADGGGGTSAAPVFATDGTSDGTHTVVVTSTDAAGNSSSASITFVLDTQAPLAAGA